MIRDRMARLQALIRREGWTGLWITQDATLAWLFGGRFHVNWATETGVAALAVTADEAVLYVDNIEGERLAIEEGAGGWPLRVHPWYSRRPDAPPGYVFDTTVERQLLPLRCFLDEEQRQWAAVGGLAVAEALEATARSLTPDDREYTVAGQLACHALSRGIEPIVNLVGGDSRRRQFRHVMPTDARVGRTVILSLGGRYRGLVLSATRVVHFGEVPAALEREYDALCRVATAMAAASAPGVPLTAVWERTVAQYAREGYADEWHHHHQGGVAGYRSREIRMRPDSAEEVAGGYMLAWNPTLPGIKVEDTALLEEDGGWRWLTRTPKTPGRLVRWGEQAWEWADIIRRSD